MNLLEAGLIAASLLCSLTAGLLFTFAVVVMPGIGSLPDRAFLRAFQVIDRVIQTNSRWFLLVWIGSVMMLLSVVAAAAVGSFTGIDRWLLFSAAATYLLCVQLPTLTANVPLNNELQKVDLDHLDAASLRAARDAFEARWNRWNRFRTVCACLTALALLTVLGRL